jgi:hypothetical protein
VSIGPKITIRRSCADCAVCQGERYTCQSDSGTDVYCAHPSFPQRRIIGDSRWDTPQWCPAGPELAARADARIAELERECDQWREELRIYRETENKRIAELEQDVTELQRIKQAAELVLRWDWSDNDDDCLDDMRELSKAIDKARAGNGGGV